MDMITVILRILHIVFGVFWAGSAVFQAAVLEPTPRKLGPSVQRPVMGGLSKVTGPALTASGLITIAAGLTLAIRLRGLDAHRWFTGGWGVAILIGLAVSLATMGTGGTTAVLAARMARMGREIGQGHPHLSRARSSRPYRPAWSCRGALPWCWSLLRWAAWRLPASCSGPGQDRCDLGLADPPQLAEAA